MSNVKHLVGPAGHRRIVHIGLPKTGTSAVQGSLFAAREVLARHGIVSVTRGHHPYRAARAAAGDPLPFMREEGERHWGRITEAFASSTAPVTYLSAESLAGATPERARAIVEELGGDLHVVVTLRALAPMLRSRWQASVIKGGQRSLHNWLKMALEPGSTALERWSVSAVLDRWGPAVGEDRMVFVVPDPADPDDLLRRFEDLLGVPTHTLAPAEWDNRGLPFTAYEMLRQHNIAEARQGLAGIEDDVTRARLRHEAMRAARAVEGLVPSSAAMPRWAAERANEVAEEWVARLRASEVTVAGDEKHLLVDTSVLPQEVPQPDSIGARDAGRLAHAMRAAALQGLHPARPVAPAPEDLGARELSRLLGRRLLRRRG